MSSDVPANNTRSGGKPWIYLNGHPGVGKLSIAQELAKLIPGSKILDNHLIIDLCRGVFERASGEYESLRRDIRRDVLTAISSTAAGRQTTYIFTGSHMLNNPIGPLVARDYEDRANASSTPFISVILHCDEGEHLRRATSPSRHGGNGTQGKLTDVPELQRIRTMEVFRFHGEHELMLDVTALTASAAAIEIKKFVDACMG